jgi:bifunctional DNA-binding transcriptional regulator/antitoxin component of YhaV-PrlF toxin-antitoxin module
MKATVSIDDVGRMVLPKAIREAMGVFGRGSVILEVLAGKAQISVAEPPHSETQRKNGRLVFSGPLPVEWNSGNAVNAMRRQRLES